MTALEDSLDVNGALERVVSSFGDRLAFRCGDGELTYAEIAAQAEEKAAAYDAAGIGGSSVVGAIADDAAEYLTDVLALLRLRACCVLLPADATEWELGRLAAVVRLDAVVSRESISAGRAEPCRTRVLTRCDGGQRSAAPRPSIGFLTSGTTGRPKVALRTEKAMLVEAAAMQRELGFAPGRRLAAMVPLHHSFGFGDCALTGLLAGAEVHSYSRMPPSAYLADFVRFDIEVVALVPPQLRLLAEASRARTFGRLSVVSGGAPLDKRTVRLASERLGCAMGQVYGTTETGVIAVAPPGEGGEGYVGRPSHHMQVALDPLPDEWGRAGAEHEEGVVRVRSGALFDGYMTLDGLDRRPIESGWFSTGDRARLVEGRLELLGRLSSAINVAGVKVSAEEVEAALLEFPGVRNALVIGVDDALTCQRIKACVTPADVDLEALRRFCEERLSASKRPHYYEAVSALPTTPSGKVIRAAGQPSSSAGSTRHAEPA